MASRRATASGLGSACSGMAGFVGNEDSDSHESRPEKHGCLQVVLGEHGPFPKQVDVAEIAIQHPDGGLETGDLPPVCAPKQVKSSSQKLLASASSSVASFHRSEKAAQRARISFQVSMAAWQSVIGVCLDRHGSLAHGAASGFEAASERKSGNPRMRGMRLPGDWRMKTTLRLRGSWVQRVSQSGSARVSPVGWKWMLTW